MNATQEAVIRDCAAASLAGTISFGDVVGRLMEVGVERYHADYSRQENTFYLPDGDSLVVSMAHVFAGDTAAHAGRLPIAETFRPEQVEAAVRKAQRGEVMYPEFVKLTTAAGCIGYFVQLTGQRVQYFGRTGDVHVEFFPGARQ